MVIFDADNTQDVSGVSPQTCFIELQIRSNVPIKAPVPSIVEDSVPDQLVEIHSGTESEVVAKLRDRIWYRRPMIALNDVRTEYKSREILEREKNQTQVIETAQEQIKGEITARTDDWDRAELICELENVGGPELSIDEAISNNENKDVSMEQLFPSIETLGDNSLIFAGRFGALEIDTLQRAMDSANDSFKPTDMVFACRPD